MPFYRSHSKWQLLQTKGRLVFGITTHFHVRYRHCKCVILTLWKLYCKSKHHVSTCTLLLLRKLQQVKNLGFWITFQQAVLKVNWQSVLLKTKEFWQNFKEKIENKISLHNFIKKHCLWCLINHFQIHKTQNSMQIGLLLRFICNRKYIHLQATPSDFESFRKVSEVI